MKEYLKRKLRTTSGMIASILVVSTLLIGLSYGTFVISTNKYKSSELLISELNYGISIIEDGTSSSTINGSSVTIPANTKSYFYITISSVNSIDSNYILGYKSINGVSVEYTDKTGWSSSGFIKGYDTETYTKRIRVVINNTSGSAQTISFKVYGGYTFNSLAQISLKDGYISVGGPYTETVAQESATLTDIIEEDVRCTTSASNPCTYEGGSINNYVQYPENSDKTKNIWRVLGSYDVDSTKSAKLISESTATTTQGNLGTALTNFYKTLENPNITVLDTDKFNCSESGCTTSSYTSIGLISTYEYNKLGGYNSYLGRTASYFALDNSSIKNITKDRIEDTSSSTTSGLRPSIYLKGDVKVKGSGTASDPYRIIQGSDINLIAWTYKGQPTTQSYNTLMSTKYVGSVSCTNGTTAEWDATTNSIILSNIKVPDYCTIDFVDAPPLKSLYATLTDGKYYTTLITNRSGGTTFDSPLGGTDLTTTYDTTKTIYKETARKEDGLDVYYFAGNPKDNWVKFAGFYWRIIRTNEDGSVRLLYAGTSPDTTTGYITVDGKTTFTYSVNNTTYDNTMYVGWKYGSGGSLSNNRGYSNEGAAKAALDKWYAANITGRDATLVSTDAIYCNDRSSDYYSADSKMYYAANHRLYRSSGKQPTYKCGEVTGTKRDTSDTWQSGTLGKMYGDASSADKFNKSGKNGGNGQLSQPVGLMTADEVAFAGGKYGSNAPNTYYYRNSKTGCTSNTDSSCSVTGTNYWWTMTPSYFGNIVASVFNVVGSRYPGFLDSSAVSDDSSYGTYVLRPVISLNSSALVSSGNGSADTPYIIE